MKQKRKFLVFMVLVAAIVTIKYYLDREFLPPSIRENAKTNKLQTENELIESEFDSIKSSEKWMLIDAIDSEILELIQMLKHYSDWTVLVYNHRRKLEKRLKSYPNGVFISKEDTKALLPYLKLSGEWLPKNLAYLFAMKHGAKYILETIGGVLPEVNRFFYNSNITAMIPVTRSQDVLYDPSPHFGQSCARIRKFPRKTVPYEENAREYHVKTIGTPTVQMVLRSRSKDIFHDSSMRFTSKNHHPRSIDNTAPPVIVPMNIYSPFLPTVRLTHSDAFFTLFTANIPSGSARDKLSSVVQVIIQQKLLSEHHMHSMFIGHKESKSQKMKFDTNLDEHVDHSDRIANVINVVRNVKCARFSWKMCFVAIYKHLRNEKLILPTDQDALSQWIDRVDNFNIRSSRRRYKGPPTDYSTPKLITFHPNEQATVVKDKKIICSEELSYQKRKNKEVLMEYCPNLNSSVVKSKNLKDVVAIIMYNRNTNSNLYALNLMYRSVFQNIIVCAQGSSIKNTAGKLHLTFIPSTEIQHSKGDRSDSLGPECLIHAMKMGYKTKGYLVMHDDLIFKFWKLRGTDYDKTRVWTAIEDLEISDYRARKKVAANGLVIGKLNELHHDQTYLERIGEAIRVIRRGTDNTRYTKCWENLQNQLVRNTMYYHGRIDLFYWPQVLADELAQVLTVFAKRHVKNEVALPNSINCIVPQHHQTTIPLQNQVYFYPLKLNEIFHNRGKKLTHFCQKVLSEIMKH